MEIYSLSEWDLRSMFDDLASDAYVFMPVFCQQEGGPRSKWEFARWEPDKTHFQLNCRRTDAISKDFFLPPKNILHTYPDGNPEKEDKETVIFGYKGCDIRSLEILDRAFSEGDFSYPFYEERRERTTIISCDCIDVSDKCFCNKVGGGPYPTSGFDLNVSNLPAYGDLIVEVGEDSAKGHEVLDRFGHYFTEATDDQIREREKHREEMTERLEEQNSYFEVGPGLDEVGADAPFWEKYSKKSSYCSAYTLACPTSLALHDLKRDGDKAEILGEVWDGATIKKMCKELESDDPTDSRIKEMFYDKFVRYYEQFGEYGCSGCGQCARIAGGEVDMRDVIHDASNCSC